MITGLNFHQTCRIQSNKTFERTKATQDSKQKLFLVPTLSSKQSLMIYFSTNKVYTGSRREVSGFMRWAATASQLVTHLVHTLFWGGQPMVGRLVGMQQLGLQEWSTRTSKHWHNNGQLSLTSKQLQIPQALHAQFLRHPTLFHMEIRHSGKDDQKDIEQCCILETYRPQW